jgi:hypothetical protein
MLIVLLLGAVGAALLSAGCGDPPPQQWQALASGQFPSAHPTALDLGTFDLAGDLRVAWTLSGTSGARSTFRLTATRSADGSGSNRASANIRSWSQDFAPRDDHVLFLGSLERGEWHLTLAQQFAPGHKSGFAGPWKVYVGTPRVD